jgi:hypothetical protein
LAAGGAAIFLDELKRDRTAFAPPGSRLDFFSIHELQNLQGTMGIDAAHALIRFCLSAIEFLHQVHKLIHGIALWVITSCLQDHIDLGLEEGAVVYLAS